MHEFSHEGEVAESKNGTPGLRAGGQEGENGSPENMVPFSGKRPKHGSILWKKAERWFHSLEKFTAAASRFSGVRSSAGFGMFLSMLRRNGAMDEMIAYCGLDCEKCDARVATLTDDAALREKTAQMWSKLNGVTITPEMINCVGCRVTAPPLENMAKRALSNVRPCNFRAEGIGG